MQAVAHLSPFDTRWTAHIEYNEGDTLHLIASRAVSVLEKQTGVVGGFGWFMDYGLIRVNGVAVARDWWAFTRPKPNMFIDMLAPPAKGNGGRIALMLAAVALTVGTGFIAGGALAGALGAGTLAAGSLGANAAAAAVGLAGSLAINALTPAPRLSQQEGGSAQRELSSAGISSNAYAPGEYILNVIGRMRISPPQIIPGYTKLEGDKVWAHMMVGINGQAKIEDILINGVPASTYPFLQMETDEGNGAIDSLFLSGSTFRHEGAALVLSDFQLQQQTGIGTQLSDQVNPDNSASKWHRFRKEAAARKLTFRVLFDGGIVNTAGTIHCVPIRMRFRKKGDTAWINGPAIFIKDTRVAGPFRRELRLEWTDDRPSAQQTSRNYNWDCALAMWRTGFGNAWAWDAATYFQNSSSTLVDEIPLMTGFTTSGVTVSASGLYAAGFEAWKACDNTSATDWISPDVSTSPWWQIDFGTAKGIRSLTMKYADAATPQFPSDYEVLGSNNGTTWASLYSVKGDIGYQKYIELPGTPYRYFRLVVTKSYSGSANVRIGEITMSLHNSYTTETNYTNVATQDTYLSRHVSLSYDGATVYLASSVFDPTAEWEVELQRGWAFQWGSFSIDIAARNTSFAYLSEAQYAHFFTYRNDSGLGARISNTLTNVFSKTIIETTQQFFPARPIAANVEKNLSRIAIRLPDVGIESVSAVFTGYARAWNGTSWDAAATISRNPAAYFRDALLLTNRNAEPLPGEVMDSASLSAAWTFANINGFTCDAIAQGRSIQEILKLLASSMRASPGQADMWGLVIDKDRSALPPSFLLTPMNSKNLGAESNWDRVPHGLRVSYTDSALDWQQREVMVYRSGFNSANATLIESWSDQTANTEAKAVASAIYHLRVMVYRNRRYQYEVGFEGRSYVRGMLGGIADEVVVRDCYYGLIKSVRTSGGNVTGFTISGTATLSGAAPFGVMVRRTDGGIFTAQITQVVGNTSIFTLVTPVANTGQFEGEQIISAGPVSKIIRRVIVHSKETAGEERWRLTLLPEAPEIFV
jgi:hypothetical protein